MARKIKIPNHIKKQLDRVESNRNENSKIKRKFFLIVCDGEQTEPNYFNSLKDSLPNGVLEITEIKIEGTGFNTKSLVKKALQLKSNWEKEINRKIDNLWVVFDKDDFTSEAFNTAILSCKNKNPEIGAAWTNEAFELWYLLHFHYYESGLSRKEYQKLIEDNFKKKKLTNYKYKKNSKEMFELLEKYGSLEVAIRNAKKLENKYINNNNFSNHNPCTMVHKLIAELLIYKNS